MRRKGLWRLLAVLFAFTLVAAACGDDDDGGGESADDGTTETTQEAEAAASLCDDLGGGGGEDTTTTTAAGGEEEDTTTTTAAKSGQDPTTTTAGGGGGAAGGTFQVGTLLPETGSLAFLGPPEFAATDLAVQEINEAGGVLGAEIPDAIRGDSGDDTTDIASQTVDRLLGEDVDVIIGAAASGVTLNVIDAITGAGVIQFSPANTSDELTTREDNGLYFRTAPPDTAQGQVLGELIAEDGNTTLAILARDDAYGTGLADRVDETFTASGGEVLEKIIYDPESQNFDADVQQLADSGADAILLVAFEEAARIYTTMVENGVGGADLPVYGTDGWVSNSLGEEFTDEGVLVGIKGTTPLTDLSDDFKSRLCEVDPELADFSYAAEGYDAVVTTALAANIAGTVDDPEAIAAEINGVTTGGETCESYADCLALIDGGTTDIDYDGISGPLEFSDVGEPTIASFGVMQYGEDNSIDSELTEFRVVDFGPLG